MVRVAAVSLLLLTGGYVVTQAVAGLTAERGGERRGVSATPYHIGQTVAAPSNGTTVIVTNEWGGTVGERSEGEIIAVDQSGTVIHYNHTFDSYNDVDPVPETLSSVIYIGHTVLNATECDAETTELCTRTHIIKLNLSTGEQTKLYTHLHSDRAYARWHDADLVNDTHLAVADIYQDRVFIVNMSSNIITYEWEARQYYSTESGGPYPDDWTHLNDVEVLHDGRLMANIRNQDEIVFLGNNGVDPTWMLGVDDNHSILYEAHNPDYIPPRNGGPAVIVADSENTRIVEYQRSNGDWQQTWAWRDRGLRWPRDADRLPNGHTLITDSNGNRIVEVNQAGVVVWSMDIGLPYEAERLHTGDESTNGPSATQADLESRIEGSVIAGTKDTGTEKEPSLTTKVLHVIIPSKIRNAILFVTPTWLNLFGVLSAAGFLTTAISWGVIELYWSPKFKFQYPVQIR